MRPIKDYSQPYREIAGMKAMGINQEKYYQLPIGAGVDLAAYDASSNLIFVLTVTAPRQLLNRASPDRYSVHSIPWDRLVCYEPLQ